MDDQDRTLKVYKNLRHSGQGQVEGLCEYLGTQKVMNSLQNNWKKVNPLISTSEDPPWANTNSVIQGGSNMTGTNCDLFTHKSSRSYLNHLVYRKMSCWYLLQGSSPSSVDSRECSQNKQTTKKNWMLGIRRNLGLQTDGFQHSVHVFKSRLWSYIARCLEMIM